MYNFILFNVCCVIIYKLFYIINLEVNNKMLSSIIKKIIMLSSLIKLNKLILYFMDKHK